MISLPASSRPIGTTITPYCRVSSTDSARRLEFSNVLGDRERGWRGGGEYDAATDLLFTLTAFETFDIPAGPTRRPLEVIPQVHRLARVAFRVGPADAPPRRLTRGIGLERCARDGAQSASPLVATPASVSGSGAPFLCDADGTFEDTGWGSGRCAGQPLGHFQARKMSAATTVSALGLIGTRSL